MVRILLNTAWFIENRFRNRGPGTWRFPMLLLKTYGSLLIISIYFGIDAGVAASFGLVASMTVDGLSEGEPWRRYLGPLTGETTVAISAVSLAINAFVIYCFTLSWWGDNSSVLAHAEFDLLAFACTFLFASLHMRGTLSELSRRLGFNVGERSPGAFGIV